MPPVEAVPGGTLSVSLVCSANGQCRRGSILARYLFTERLQVTSLPRLNMEQNLCCGGATPLTAICLDVFVRRETHLNGAGIVLQATLCAAFEQHPTN